MSSPVPTASGDTTPDNTASRHYLEGAARTKLVVWMLITTTALFSCYLAAGAVLLPAQVQNIDPALKEANLAIVTSISSFATLFCQPIVGALSDRTRSKLGRRAPWMLGGAFLGGIMLALLPVIGTNVALIAIMWVLAQVSLNGLQGPLSALVSDRLAENYRGTASAFFGVGSTIGMTLGVVVAGLLINQIGLGYAIFGGGVIVATVLLVVFNQDRSSADMRPAPFSLVNLFKGFGTPFRSADFTWAWLQRFVMFLGSMGIVNYMLYILQEYIGMSQAEAGGFMAIQQLVYAAASIIATFIAGRMSDRLGRRKIFVFIASGLFALGLVVLLLMPTPTGVLIYAVLGGMGFGAYMAVDVALVVDILPDPNDAAKDLGVINIANNVPQMLAPIINVFLIGAFGYVGLFPWGIALVLAASLLVIPIKKVR
ncbi:MAG: MFS transporter [Propionibacteriaceae bacterium]|nr:MFS transporter [Propionibacteriaceae bacterium]